jgi:hypothetical protein
MELFTQAVLEALEQTPTAQVAEEQVLLLMEVMLRVQVAVQVVLVAAVVVQQVAARKAQAAQEFFIFTIKRIKQ